MILSGIIDTLDLNFLFDTKHDVRNATAINELSGKDSSQFQPFIQKLFPYCIFSCDGQLIHFVPGFQ